LLQFFVVDSLRRSSLLGSQETSFKISRASKIHQSETKSSQLVDDLQIMVVKNAKVRAALATFGKFVWVLQILSL